MRSRLDLSNRLHQCILNRYTDIATGISLAHLTQGSEIRRLQITRRVSDGHFEHFHAAGQIGETDVDAALEASSDGRVELPGYVCCS